MRPLAQMGACIEARENRFPPLTIHGGKLHPDRVYAADGKRPGEELRLLAGLYRRRPDHGA